MLHRLRQTAMLVASAIKDGSPSQSFSIVNSDVLNRQFRRDLSSLENSNKTGTKRRETDKISGDHGGEETPVPIPNTVVKLSSAKNTAAQLWWEDRTLPGYFRRPGAHSPGCAPGLFVFLSPFPSPLPSSPHPSSASGPHSSFRLPSDSIPANRILAAESR